MSKWSIETLLIGLKGIKGIKYKTRTSLIREIKKAQILLNLLIGLKGINGIKYKNSFGLSTKSLET